MHILALRRGVYVVFLIRCRYWNVDRHHVGGIRYLCNLCPQRCHEVDRGVPHGVPMTWIKSQQGIAPRFIHTFTNHSSVERESCRASIAHKLICADHVRVSRFPSPLKSKRSSCLESCQDREMVGFFVPLMSARSHSLQLPAEATLGEAFAIA